MLLCDTVIITRQQQLIFNRTLINPTNPTLAGNMVKYTPRVLFLYFYEGDFSRASTEITVSHGSATLLKGRRSKSMGNGNFGGVRTP